MLSLHQTRGVTQQAEQSTLNKKEQDILILPELSLRFFIYHQKTGRWWSTVGQPAFLAMADKEVIARIILDLAKGVLKNQPEEYQRTLAEAYQMQSHNLM